VVLAMKLVEGGDARAKKRKRRVNDGCGR
jgi:hypothetical protein